MIFQHIQRQNKWLCNFLMNIVYMLEDLCLSRFSPVCVDTEEDKKLLPAAFFSDGTLLKGRPALGFDAMARECHTKLSWLINKKSFAVHAAS